MSDTPISRHVLNRQRAARRHSRLVDAALARASTYAHPAGRIVRIETHISVVYLAGRYAYKIMKPVDFGFVNFVQLDARLRCCEAEIRLNAPFAGPIYRDTGELFFDGRRCRLRRGVRGDVSVVDYAVRMRRFDQRLLFSNLLSHGELSTVDIDAAATKLAVSHRHARRAGRGPMAPAARLGTAALLREQVLAALAPLEADPRTAHAVESAALRATCENELARLARHLDARRANGFVRACHGDLHLDNIVRYGRHALMFDCIEFSDELRWIDVTCDLAFLLMDLRAHGHAAYAHRLLNHYLEATGDFAGLAALRLYVAYRALVRALVAMLKAGSPARSDAQASAGAASRYLALAAGEARAMREHAPWLLLCHGFSGSGKSVASRALAELSGAIRVSSDLERKRLEPFAPPSLDALPPGAYTQAALDAHYVRLVAHVRDVLNAGYTALVDATFLKAAHRARFAALARELNRPMLILNFHAPQARLAERVNARARGPRDASDAGADVLAAQFAQADPLDEHERQRTVDLNTDVEIEAFSREPWWAPLFSRMRAENGGI
ncbi:AAA family ATPase [Paraburkholderia sp. CNPSo 3274]|uniref:bifunctional aminoglycoside phosphotransferase/ATP-binding protein n=1 Tax=Paraburkholderia sp. CNPSo 3274 TaxID=2940932 RepID=UPI0020B784AE|nr:bifunctional aminoglycoside phosphotransferase/ATP-binding protein [Paraburkholderia sp. CNPSo 3274]MCP3712103.1 AAA family ATPase [Paraburkholderia sp. CNPSo 3274]